MAAGKCKASHSQKRRVGGFLSLADAVSTIDRSGMSKEQAREVEQRLLRPPSLLSYDGETPEGIDPLAKQRVMIVFKSARDVALLVKHFKVNTYAGLNITGGKNIRKLLDFLRALDDRTLHYDSDTRKFSTTHRRRNSR